MKLSPNMRIVQDSTDEHFIHWLAFIRPDHFEKWEEKLLMTMIQKRLKVLGYTFEFGCCGTNIVRKIKK